MTNDEMREIYAHDLQMSKDMGVPHPLYENSPGFIDWYGRFTVQINGREFKMAVTPSTLFIDESDPSGPAAQLTGSEWLDTPLGRVFHATYVTHKVHGGFQMFRMANSSPFHGFESVPHTHLLVYKNGAGEKQFFPVVVSFAIQ